jgi:hypothetical protein
MAPSFNNPGATPENWPAKQVMEIPRGHRFGFHNLRHALTSFRVEIGTDSKTIQDRCALPADLNR